METFNNKRIEETATTALKAALLHCPVLEPFISDNDKTPSWDGTVFVYKNSSQKKEDILGRAPVQIKGTEKRIASKTASYSCKVTDLRNYYNDGGCIFFLISVNTKTGRSNIYYSSLHVFDLKKILNNAGRHKTTTIILKRFPKRDINETASVFLSFVENSRKQTSFIGKDIISLQQLKNSGVEIESVSFNTSGIGLTPNNIGNFISTHEFYLYAKPKGLDIDIPVDKISNAIVSRTVFGSVLVKNIEYFPSYCVLYEKGNMVFRIGKGICISPDFPNRKITVNFKPTGTLSDFIQDASCFMEMMENREVTLNGVHLPFNGMGTIDNLSQLKENLKHYKDVKRMLDLIGVKDELRFEELSDKDEINLDNLVNSVLYHKRINFPNLKEEISYGAMKIANLSVWIWAIKHEDGYYQLHNFFEPSEIKLYEADDVNKNNPISATHYLLLNKDAFIHASNMDYEAIKDDVHTMKVHPAVVAETTQLLLNVLRGYDEREDNDLALLKVADVIIDWLASDKDSAKDPIFRLNQLQVDVHLLLKRLLSLGNIQI